MNTPFHVAAAVALALALGPAPIRADEYDDERIEDNSFLVEEAYNQEPGVVQHVFTFQQGFARLDWAASFTEEWPAPDQRRQLSVTLTGLRNPGTPDAAGFGDLLLNYRHEMVRTEGGATVATARLSLVIPSGDASRGLGLGHLGLQTNFPVSLLLGRSFAAHLNLGGTWVPGASAGGERGDLWTLSGGASLVWFAARELNVLLEGVGNRFWFEPPSGSQPSTTWFVSPGFRHLVQLGGTLEAVWGLAAPIRLAPGEPATAGLFAYLSLEHELWSGGAH